MGYSSISSSRIALWATNDMGFFAKNGLAAEVIVTPGVQGTRALIAGELQFYLRGVDSAALAAVRGSDLVALATAERVGGTNYYISLQILQKVGLKTGDVELVQVGGGGNQRSRHSNPALSRALSRPLIGQQDAKVIDETYDYFAPTFSFPPRVDRDGIRNALELVSAVTVKRRVKST